MNLDKNSRSIPLHCPTCAGTTFKSESPESLSVTCTDCERVISKDELCRENEENVQEHLGEISKRVADDLRKRLQKAFKGSKGFKLK